MHPEPISKGQQLNKPHSRIVVVEKGPAPWMSFENVKVAREQTVLECDKISQQR